MDRGVRLPVNLIIRRFVLKASLLFFVSMGSTFAADEFRVDRQRVADPTKPSGFSRWLRRKLCRKRQIIIH